MNKKYHIVEFDDGVQIVPINWFTNGEKVAVYWPNLSSQKEYDKAIEKMKNFNIDNSSIANVKRILGNTGQCKVFCRLKSCVSNFVLINVESRILYSLNIIGCR